MACVCTMVCAIHVILSSKLRVVGGLNILPDAVPTGLVGYWNFDSAGVSCSL